MSAFRRSEYVDQQGNLCLEMTVQQDAFEREHSITDLKAQAFKVELM